ncbi:MAG: HepT-like ribonuclease domain-containing protein [Microbacterium sp.]
MSRRTIQRLRDIAAACAAIARHIERSDADDEIVFDAVRARLIEIGEAVKDLERPLTASEPDIPWTDIARMRDHLAHRYFDTTHAIVTATARHDIPRLEAAISRMLDELD